MNPHDELLALRHEVEALRLTNAALQQRLSADAEQTDTMLRELEAKGNELRNAGRRQLDLAAFTQRVIDAVGALVIVLDNQGAIQRINLAASIYLGIKMPLSAALTLDDWLDPRALAVLRATLGERPWEIRSVVLECAREQGQYRGEHTLRGASGSARHFLLETSLIYNRQGKEEGAVVCATNIQSLKDAEVDLRLAASVFENSRNGITITNAEAVIQRANAAFTEILGYEAEECIGQPVSLLRSDLHDQAFYERMWHSLNTLGRWQGEIIDRHKNGELVHIWQSISSVRGDDGATSHYVANFVDISAQKALERELRSAKESAEAAARAKGDFLANMSHEIRTPMNGIIGLLKLLEYTPLDPTQHDYVIKTKSAATSLLGILNDILDYSKVAAGKMQLERQPFSLGALMQDVGIIATANLGEKILELVYNIAPEVPDQLLGDALRLKQVLTNLIGNAIKFTATGEIVVGVRCVTNDERGELAGDEVALEFSVQDSGIGIPADKLATIFDSFSQADSSTTRKFGGTGLGLAISQSLVTLMGGQLAVESVYGQGSCFHFCAHLGRGLVSEPPVPPSEAEVILDPETGLPLGRQLRTLIVDDNATARTTLGQMCERFGWQVSMAAGGEEALAACAAASARGEDFQLVLMDWRMPGMDGMSATRQLRGTLAGGRRPVVILLTAFDPGQVLQADPSAKNLFDGILMKPVTESTVFDTVLHSRAGRPRRAQP